MSEKVPSTGDESPERYAPPVMLGGPLYRLLLRMRLSGLQPAVSATPDFGDPHSRVASAAGTDRLEGHAWGGLGVPFLKDVDAQARLLVSLPLLIASETIVHRQMLGSIPLFTERGLIEGAQRAQFAERH